MVPIRAKSLICGKSGKSFKQRDAWANWRSSIFQIFFFTQILCEKWCTKVKCCEKFNWCDLVRNLFCWKYYKDISVRGVVKDNVLRQDTESIHQYHKKSQLFIVFKNGQFIAFLKSHMSSEILAKKTGSQRVGIFPCNSFQSKLIVDIVMVFSFPSRQILAQVQQ